MMIKFFIAIADIETKENRIVFAENMASLIDNAKAFMVGNIGRNDFPSVTQSLDELEEQFSGRFVLSAYHYLDGLK